MIARVLESISALHKLAMRILLFFLMSSVPQLEAEIPTPIYLQKLYLFKQIIKRKLK